MSSSARWVGVFDSLRRWRGEGRVSVDDALEEIGRIASSSLSIDEVCDRLVQPVSQLVPFDRLNVGYVDLEKGTFTDAYVTGLEVPAGSPGTSGP